MLETRQGVEQIDDILSVPGVDGVYVGPSDLSVSYGLEPGGLLRDPDQKQVFETIADACRRHGVVAGIHATDVDTAVAFREAGYRMLNVASDFAFLRQGAARVVKDLIAEAPAPKVKAGTYT